MADPSLAGRTAAELAELVRSGDATAVEVVHAHLAQLSRTGDPFGAFEYLVGEDAAIREAAAVDARQDRPRLPLAGVPVAVKDNVGVAGVPMRRGSRATPAGPSGADHPVVARLRAAGAVVIGTTRVPELCLWGTSDNAFGTARSPWNPERTAGGSSGGSAAAVAAGLVPIAHGNDGLGSIRIPAACCGLVGIKPGPGVVPSTLGADSWYGIAENGALATTVRDAALLLAVLAGDEGLARVERPGRLRIGVALRPPAPGIGVDPHVASHTREAAAVLADAGHRIEFVRPPTPSPLAAIAILGTWTAGARSEVEALLADVADAWPQLEPRTRAHATAGRIARRAGLAGESHRQRWRARMQEFFARFDLMLTPTLATPPLRADGWRDRGWLANLDANLRAAPYCGPVNFARLPAISLPAGRFPDGTPGSVHLVGPERSERRLLGLAAEIEELRPWTRLAPRISHAPPVIPGTRA